MARFYQTRLFLLAVYLMLLVHVTATYPGIEVKDVPRIEAQKPIDPEVYMKAVPYLEHSLAVCN